MPMEPEARCIPQAPEDREGEDTRWAGGRRCQEFPQVPGEREGEVTRWAGAGPGTRKPPVTRGSPGESDAAFVDR